MVSEPGNKKKSCVLNIVISELLMYDADISSTQCAVCLYFNSCGGVWLGTCYLGQKLVYSNCTIWQSNGALVKWQMSLWKLKYSEKNIPTTYHPTWASLKGAPNCAHKLMSSWICPKGIKTRASLQNLLHAKQRQCCKFLVFLIILGGRHGFFTSHKWNQMNPHLFRDRNMLTAGGICTYMYVSVHVKSL
jgi:hypothetical protein